MKGTKIYQGHYTIGDVIASGGFATIYQAEEVGREESVAIKIAKKGGDHGVNASVYKEAEVLANFDHESVIYLYTIPPMVGKKDVRIWANVTNVQGNPPFFVMEHLTGGTLQRYMDHVKSISGEEAAAIGVQIARGLDHVHRKNFAHNDLKLENIVFRQPVTVGARFDPVLIDFGIATKVKMQTGQGTLYIMSPEQLALADEGLSSAEREEQESGLDKKKVDVWGLGVVLYYLVAGQLPFPGRTAKGITSRIRHNQPEPLSGLVSHPISSYLEEIIVEGCLAKDPRYRLELIELGMALKGIAQEVTASKAGPSRKRRRFW